MFRLMVDYLRGTVDHEAFFKKYASKKFLKGALPVIFTFMCFLTNHLLSFNCSFRAKRPLRAPLAVRPAAPHNNLWANSSRSLSMQWTRTGT